MNSMRPPTDAEREWVENWKRVGPELAAIRVQELREMSAEERLETVDVLLQLAPSSWRSDEDGRDMIEQRRLLDCTAG